MTVSGAVGFLGCVFFATELRSYFFALCVSDVRVIALHFLLGF